MLSRAESKAATIFVTTLVADKWRTFGDDDDVGTLASATELAEIAERKYMVVEVGGVVLGEQNHQVGTQSAVLIDVVEKNNIET